MPSVGRKFLLAGIGGLNLTHSEPLPRFVQRYGERAGRGARAGSTVSIRDALRRWAAGLGIETFVGSSGRVFPTDMKAAPLLRAWLQRLRRARRAAAHAAPLGRLARWRCRLRRRRCGSRHAAGEQQVAADVVVLALGGGSWPRLGSDGAWVPLLAQRGVDGGAAAAGQLRLRCRRARGRRAASAGASAFASALPAGR